MGFSVAFRGAYLAPPFCLRLVLLQSHKSTKSHFMLPMSGLLLLGPGSFRSGVAVVAWRFRGRVLPGLGAFANVVSRSVAPRCSAPFGAPLSTTSSSLHCISFSTHFFLPHVQLNHGDMTPRIAR